MAEEAHRCRWKPPLDSDYICPELALPLSKDWYCIFHERSSDKDPEAFREGISRKLNNHDFDFSGYYFTSPASFHEFNFDGDVSFSWAQFCASADFSYAIFSGVKTDFSSARFLGKSTEFSVGRFSAEKTSFANAEFSSASTAFEVTEFLSEGTDFREARFSGQHTSFLGARFSRGTVDFARATFKASKTVFTSAVFHGSRTGFGSARFEGHKTEFRGTYFHFAIAFIGTEFSANETDFHGARFGNSMIDFTRARFSSTWTDFSGVKLSSSRFVNARWQAADFTNATWNTGPGGRSICMDELKAESSEDYTKAAAVCRNIKQAYQAIGDYGNAREFFYGEMECIRTSARWSVKWLGLTLLKLICGYGERPWRVVITWAGVVLLFAMIYAFAGISTEDGNTTRLISHLVRRQEIAAHLWHCVYFSGVTFTTLGYGDFQPATTTSQVAAFVEASLGAFLMALYILVVGRKLLR